MSSYSILIHNFSLINNFLFGFHNRASFSLVQILNHFIKLRHHYILGFIFGHWYYSNSSFVFLSVFLMFHTTVVDDISYATRINNCNLFLRHGYYRSNITSLSSFPCKLLSFLLRSLLWHRQPIVTDLRHGHKNEWKERAARFSLVGPTFIFSFWIDYENSKSLLIWIS